MPLESTYSYSYRFGQTYTAETLKIAPFKSMQVSENSLQNLNNKVYNDHQMDVSCNHSKKSKIIKRKCIFSSKRFHSIVTIHLLKTIQNGLYLWFPVSLILIGSFNVTVGSQYLPLPLLRHQEARQLIIPTADISTGIVFSTNLSPHFLGDTYELEYKHMNSYPAVKIADR